MKLATIKNGLRDGRLAVVSRDLTRAAYVDAIASTMIEAIENWAEVESSLQTIYAELNHGVIEDGFTFDAAEVIAPLPRCYQFIDASTLPFYADLTVKGSDISSKACSTSTLLQRQSDDFRGAMEDYPFPSEDDDGDFEGGYAVIIDDVLMDTSTNDALEHIKLITMFNDVSMRAHPFNELSMGVGFIQAKPSTVFAPVAVTPDELGGAWRGGLVHLDIQIKINNEWFGSPNSSQMDFTFGQIISHLAYNRNLQAGAIIGSATVSNSNREEAGAACIAEQRELDKLKYGEIKTDFLRFGDQLYFEVFDERRRSIFGAINHKMVKLG